MSWDDERSSELDAMSDNELDTLTLRIDEQKSLSKKGAERTPRSDMSAVWGSVNTEEGEKTLLAVTSKCAKGLATVNLRN